MSAPMDAREAWVTLGRDPTMVFSRLARLPREARVAAAIEDLAEAKRAAKSLMAAMHPDRGGNQASFVKIGEAISALEAHTSEFERKMKAAVEEAAMRQEKRPVFIKIGD